MGVKWHKRGGIYHARITLDGKEYRRSLKTSRVKEARKRAYELEAEILRVLTGGETPQKPTKKRLLLSEFAKEYLEAAVSSQEKAPQTVKIERYALDFATRKLGNVGLLAMERRDIERLVQVYLKDGRSATCPSRKSELLGMR